MGARTVKRSVVVLFCCAMVVFAIVWRITPEFAQGVMELRSYVEQVKSPAPEAEADKPAKVVKKPVARKARTVEVSSEPKTTPMPVHTEIVNVVPQAEVRPPVQIPYGPSDFQVATESAELYSSNSPNGSVVRMLNKGELVELQFKVNNAGPEWMFVNVVNPKGSGFLRSDLVAKAEPTTR